MRELKMTLLACATLVHLAGATSAAETSDYPFRPVKFTDVKIADEFWAPRIKTNCRVSIPYAFRRCEETDRISNFAKAAGMEKGFFQGIFFNDSDVFKVIEGASYTLAVERNPELDAYLDALIEKIAGAQEDDGYLYTARTIDPKHLPLGVSKERWGDLKRAHELYNVGHLYEAAVAHYLATGKRSLLDVAIKSADLVDSVFGPDKLVGVPGHEEIEIGLVKLYRVTGERRYLDLARFFLDARGDASRRKVFGPYCQDHKPVTEQDEPVGHAVRAGYLYSGMADVAAITGDAAYVGALNKIWTNTASCKLYVTGGIGARHSGEAFGENYELPNASAYAETCAAIANALWNHRMFLLSGDARYVDVLERVFYNGFLSGVSLSGDRFFYTNPLACEAGYNPKEGEGRRQPWFGCACCPTNVVRVLPSLSGYVYACGDDAVYVNLYVASTGSVSVGKLSAKLTQKTRYPWDGRVEITVEPESEAEFDIRVRIPGWAANKPVPSDLYRFLDECDESVKIEVNGKPWSTEPVKGYAVIRRSWKKGDTILIDLPMPVRRLVAHPNVRDDVGRVALQRGPTVYCFEAADHDGYVRNLSLPDDAELTMQHRADMLGGITVIKAKGLSKRLVDEEGEAKTEPAELTAIPYYAWSHRGDGEMAVWIPRTQDLARPSPAPTIASTSRVTASHAWHADTIGALNDQIEPKNSIDHSIPRFTWWDHRGTTEWVQYDFAAPARISRVEVYWFDDTGRGQCRAPAKWRMLRKAGDQWQPVGNPSGYGTEADIYNVATFDPVETTALRLEVRLQKDFSGGILEWRVKE